jgi:hypothetical protein
LGVASIDSYRLAVSPAYRLLVFGVMLAMSLVGAGMIVSRIKAANPNFDVVGI